MFFLYCSLNSLSVRVPHNLSKASIGNSRPESVDGLKPMLLTRVFRFVNVKRVVGEHFSRFLSSGRLLDPFSYSFGVPRQKNVLLIDSLWKVLLEVFLKVFFYFFWTESIKQMLFKHFLNRFYKTNAF